MRLKIWTHQTRIKGLLAMKGDCDGSCTLIKGNLFILAGGSKPEEHLLAVSCKTEFFVGLFFSLTCTDVLSGVSHIVWSWLCYPSVNLCPKINFGKST